MAQHIDLLRLEQAMQAAKKYTDTQKAAVDTEVNGLSTRLETAENTITTQGGRIDKVEQAVAGGVQAPDAALDSIAALTGTGVVKMTGEDTFALDTIGDADVKAGEALSFAKDAFAAKNGSVKVAAINSDAAVTITAADDGHGKPNVLIKTTAGTADRVVGVTEMNKAIADASSTSHVYMGKFTFFATADTADDAKALITGTKNGDTAIVFAAGKVESGKYTDTWAWEDATWHNGSWAWVEDIMTATPAGNEYPSGRVIMHQGESGSVIDVIEDVIAKPDNVTLTYTTDGAIGFKKVTNADNYGSTEVLAGADAASIGYGEGKTIKEKIASMEYTVATEEEVKGMLDRVFGTKA